MPKFDEWAEVEAGGQIYKEWTGVTVSRGLSGQGVSTAMLQAIEPSSGSGASYANIKLKPGDQVTVTLAGYRVFKGFVVDRQAVYDAQNHGVQIVAEAAYSDIVYSNAPLKGSQFRDYAFEPIAKKILEPFGLKLKIENPPKDVSKKFKDISVNPGDTAYSFLERLARMRGLHLRSGEDGEVIAGKMKDGSAPIADLEEGKNILSALIRISDRTAFSKAQFPGQQRGDDQTNGDAARKPAAFVEGSDSSRYKLLVVLPETPGDKDDMRIRADRQADDFMGAMINAQVTVQGWLKPSGGIWKEFETVRLVSPMGLMKHSLGVQDVTYTQDQSGTKTTLVLVRPEALGSITPPGVSAGEGGVLPGGTQRDAQPEAD